MSYKNEQFCRTQRSAALGLFHIWLFRPCRVTETAFVVVADKKIEFFWIKHTYCVKFSLWHHFALFRSQRIPLLCHIGTMVVNCIQTQYSETEWLESSASTHTTSYSTPSLLFSGYFACLAAYCRAPWHWFVARQPLLIASSIVVLKVLVRLWKLDASSLFRVRIVSAI